MDHLAQRLAEQDVLRPEVFVEQAADLLFLLTSFAAFDQLHTGRGLSADNVVDMLVTTAERSLCR
jgi:hypothetical protein